MPKPTKGPRIGGSPTHERMILANLASQLFEHGRITTTETRAKRVQPLAEKLITKAKRGDLHSRRVVRKTITDTTVLHVLFTQIAPALMGRDGGCTRITRVGNRKGDNAPLAVIEIVKDEVKPKAKAKKTGTGPAEKTADKAPAAEPVEEIAPVAVQADEPVETAAEPEEATETVVDEAAEATEEK